MVIVCIYACMCVCALVLLYILTNIPIASHEKCHGSARSQALRQQPWACAHSFSTQG